MFSESYDSGISSASSSTNGQFSALDEPVDVVDDELAEDDCVEQEVESESLSVVDEIDELISIGCELVITSRKYRATKANVLIRHFVWICAVG